MGSKPIRTCLRCGTVHDQEICPVCRNPYEYVYGGAVG